MSSSHYDNASDTQIKVETADGKKAEAAIWWQKVPVLANEQLGLIGRFEAENEEAALMLLAQCTSRLAAEGCTLAVGPMDGSTWQRYRWVTETGEDAPFFLEPSNPAVYPEYFEKAGFEAKWHYISSRERQLNEIDPRLSDIETRMQSQGVSLRPIDPEQYEAELDRIYDVSILSFKQNTLYTEIDREQFKSQYRLIMPFVVPQLVWLAEQASQPVGFAFAVPDYAQQSRGIPVDTVVFKTIAILPNKTLSGLGTMLAEKVRSEALELGYTQLIYALIFEENHSRAIPQRHGAEIIRHYSLYARKL